MNPEKTQHATIREDDTEARAAALDPALSILVEAPAGSGKTGLLVQRFLRLLATVDRPERILAITFTRKAAAEMRERILEALARAESSASPPEDPYAQKTFELAKAARSQAQAMGWDLAALAGRLRIQTIDSFCAWLARRAPLVAGAAASARILEEEEAMAFYLEAADRALAACAETAALLARYRGDAEALRRDLADLLARRERLRGLLDGENGQGVEAALQAYLEEQLAFLDNRLAKLREPLERALAYARGNLLKDHRFHLVNPWPEPRPEQLSAWRALADFCLTKDGTVRKKLDKNDGFPSASDSSTVPLDKTLAKQHKEDALSTLRELANDHEAVAALHRIRLLPEASSAAGWQGLNALQALLRRALAELKLLFAERAAVDFSEVGFAALEVLGTPDAPSNLLLSLDQEIHHILVDEFQDTSALQIELLRRLTAGWQAGDQRSLFLVGDPMQSIYRFRQAELGLFLEVRERKALGALPLECLTLSRNFRSRRELVEEVNRRFGKLLPEHDQPQEERAARRMATPTREGAAAVEYRWLHCPQERALAERARNAFVSDIADWIEDKMPSGQVAVLVRSREHALPLLKVLSKRRLSVHAPDFDRLEERALITDLAALALALSHPCDRPAWLGVLRAPWCGLSQADLAALCQDLAPSEPLWPRLLAIADASKRDGSLSPEGGTRLHDLIERLRPFIARGGREPLRERLEAAWLALGGPACARDEAELADAERFFAWLEKQGDQTLIHDQERFLAGLSRLRAAALAPPDAQIVLLTIHQAKGLEFPHVVLFGLGAPVRHSDQPMLVATHLIAKGERWPLIAIKPAPGEDKRLYEFAWTMLEKPREEAERERLLYVAMTRARESLLLACELKAVAETSSRQGARIWRPSKGSLGEVLWRSLENGELPQAAEQTTPAAPPTAAFEPISGSEGRSEGAAAQAPRPRLRRIKLPHVEAETTASISEAGDATQPGRPRFVWAGEPARLAGVLFHRFAERLSEHPELFGSALPPALRSSCEPELAAAGLAESECEDAIARIEAALAVIANDPLAKWLFSDHQGSARSEWELLTREADGRIRRHRIDRTFVDQGTRWIVDFKLGRHEGGDLEGFIAEEKARYREQLLRYAELFAHEGRPIRLALYYPLLPEGHRLIEIEADDELAPAAEPVATA